MSNPPFDADPGPAGNLDRSREDAEVVLELSDVSIVRDGSRLLDRVDWVVREGDRWVVLGPNGAGKTTMLQVCSARMHPTTGSAELLGEVLGRISVAELRQRIGLASAALAEAIPPRERVLDVVVTAAWAVVGRWREPYEAADVERARGLLAQVGAAELEQRRYGTLSEGERKRVQVARALMPDPELLLLDEPAAGLDLGGREDLVRRLSRLASDPLAPTSVVVTHHVEEIPVGVTHALLLRQGKVLAAGPAPQVLTGPLLSQAFDLELAVVTMGGRWYARARGDGR